MEENQGTEKKLVPVTGKTALIDQWILFGANALLMLVYTVQHFSLTELIVYVCCMALLYVSRKKEPVPALSRVPACLLADLTIVGFSNLSMLTSSVNVYGLRFLLNRFAPLSLVLAAAGMALFLIARSRSSVILKGVSGTIIVLAAALGSFSTFTFSQFDFYTHGKLLACIVLAGGFCWTLLQQVISLTVPQEQQSARWAGIVIVPVCAAVIILAPTAVNDFLFSCARKAEALFAGNLTGWKVLFAAAIVLGLDVALYKADDRRFSVDAYGLILLLEVYVSLQLLTLFYSAFNWVLAVLLTGGTVRCMRNEYSGEKTMGLSSKWYLSAQAVAFFATVLMLHWCLWFNLLFSVLIVLLFMYKRDAGKNRKSLLRWILVELSIGVEAAGLLFQYRRSMDALVVVCAVLAVTIVTTCLLHTDYKVVKLPLSKWIMPAICCALAVLCLLPLLRFGARITCTSGESVGSAKSVTIRSRGKSNQIANAYYFCRYKFGRKVEGTYAAGLQTSVPKAGDLLVVVAVDKHGVETRAYYWWAPSGLLN